jgi:hypothetical protein
MPCVQKSNTNGPRPQWAFNAGTSQLALTVVPASSYVRDTLKVYGIPQNWIVDSGGVVRLKGTGYDATEKWETGMREAIEKVKPAPAAPASSASSK